MRNKEESRFNKYNSTVYDIRNAARRIGLFNTSINMLN